MNNNKLARETLYIENKKIVIVKNDSVIYKSDDSGIKPLFFAFRTLGEKMNGCYCADRVVGKAAAWIYQEAKIKELYCDIITKKAKLILENEGILVTAIEVIDYIKNRDKTDMCPVEKIAKNETSFEKLMENIEAFLIKIGDI
ncbi:DUF1893 domain-containing protein [Sedimentibacter sp. zth1]|uniref:DUF1893 domain-containing protein n=1 Tax=Sedimentibacter sp. zth1 TaxID=2816908 RepID=UPI001A91339B|nr:DUF1893 domain-containing protein [Sedimentibacter sp. zth1]QSX05142.1 DUF1893 domain-containing protein [Sedimentibacter sp. zth1]